MNILKKVYQDDYRIMFLGEFLTLAGYLDSRQVKNNQNDQLSKELSSLLSKVTVIFKKSSDNPKSLPKLNLKAPRYLFHDLHGSASLNSQSSSLNLTQVIDRSIHHLLSNSQTNILTNGYKRMGLELECVFPNTVLNHLHSKVWEQLLQM
jgi:hypothetical protein